LPNSVDFWGAVSGWKSQVSVDNPYMLCYDDGVKNNPLQTSQGILPRETRSQERVFFAFLTDWAAIHAEWQKQ
jgi:hypothetical protein